MLLADFTTITNLHPVIHNEIADDRRALACALACCTLSFLVLMPLLHLSFNGCGGPTIQSGKPLVDHIEILCSSDNASCHYLKLPSTHTTYGQLSTSTTHASSTMTPFAAILRASEASFNPSETPLPPNMFVRPWHRAPHASTFCSQTSNTM